MIAKKMRQRLQFSASLVASSVIVLAYLAFDSDFFLPSYPTLTVLCLGAAGAGIYFIGNSPRLSPAVVKHPVVVLLTLFVLWCYVSLAWAVPITGASEGLTRVTVFFFGFWGFLILFTHPRLSQVYHSRWFACAVALLGVCYLKVLLFYNQPPPGFGFPFGNPNLAGSVLGFGIMMILPEVVRRPRHSLFSGLLLAFLVLLLILARSKGAFLALGVVGGGIVFLLHPRWRMPLLVGAGLGILALWQLWQAILVKAKDTIEVRYYLWEGTLAMINASPMRSFLGWGVGSFFYQYPHWQNPLSYTVRYHSEIVYYPHCYTLELWAELGLLGTMLFFALIAVAIYQVWQIHRHYPQHYLPALAMAGGLVFLLLHSQVSVAFSYPQVQIFAALALAWLTSHTQPQLFNLPKRNGQWRYLRLALIVLASGVALYCCGHVMEHWQFHRQYKAALHEAHQSSKEAIDEFISMEAPRWESRYSIAWRQSLGEVLVSHYESNPRLVAESIDPFLRLEHIYPNYGRWHIVYALWLAKQDKVKQAQESLAQYAQKNPFSPDLWIWWTRICENEQVSAKKMLATVRKYQRRYPQDAALLLGEALALYSENRIEPAQVLLEQAREWARERLENKNDHRARAILDLQLRVSSPLSSEK